MTWLLLKPIRPFLALAALASLLLNVALLVPALYMLQVFERVFSSRSVETLAMLTLFALLALGLAFAMDRSRSLLLARAGRAADEALSAPALEAMLQDAARGRRRADDAHLPDVARLRNFLASPAVHALFDAPWLPIHLLAVAALHPALGWAATAAAALLFGLGLLSERLMRRDAESTQRGGRAAGLRIETLRRHADELVAGGTLGAAIAGWLQVHRDAQQCQARHAVTAATLAALGRALRQLVQVGMLGLGAWLVIVDHASPGIMIAATLLVGRALQPVEQLIAGWTALVEVRAAWRRLQQPLPDAPRDAAAELPPLRGELRLERVSLLADPKRPPLIKGVSLELQPGRCVGLIGPSGCGKTTLLRLMLGLHEPHAGTVRLDGIELAQWPLAQRGGVAGYLPQHVELADGSIAHNIARLGPVDLERVVEAARLAGVHELVARLPQAYATELRDGGLPLSGGQRQRLALARALYGAPQIVVLDEPAAHLDAEGEDALGAALVELKRRGATVVLATHRPRLIRHVDTLVLLRDGALDAVGPRDEVLARLNNPSVRPLRRADAAVAVAQGV